MYGLFIELHKRENFPHYSLHEIYHSELRSWQAPLFKTAPPTIIHYKNLLTISQVFQVKEATKFKSVSIIILIKALKPLIIHSKYFPDSDWLKAHA